jgi:hypothetical protein
MMPAVAFVVNVVERLLLALLILFFFCVGFRFVHSQQPQILKAAVAFLIGGAILLATSTRARAKK